MAGVEELRRMVERVVDEVYGDYAEAVGRLAERLAGIPGLREKLRELEHGEREQLVDAIVKDLDRLLRESCEPELAVAFGAPFLALPAVEAVLQGKWSSLDEASQTADAVADLLAETIRLQARLWGRLAALVRMMRGGGGCRG